MDEFLPAEVITVELRRRVLVAATGELREGLTAALRGGGFDVRTASSPAEALALLDQSLPDLVVIAEALEGAAGRQLVLSLRARGETFPVPVAGVLGDVSVPNVLRWLRVGATDLWRFPFSREVPRRTRDLIDECDRSQVQLGQMRTRLLAWARRAGLSGTVVFSAGTPFEGRATFREGALERASFGTLDGERALEPMMELDDGPVEWLEGVITPPDADEAVEGFRARVLLVEDDHALRGLVARQLETLGVQVESACDGRAALQATIATPFDVVVADLEMPHLDGWGLLRELQADVATRELAVLVMSAHGDAVDTLKAARAGARAYLKKSGRAKELLDSVSLLVTPRARAWTSLSRRRETKVELRAVGPVWLLRTLAELDCQGRLELEDVMGRYEVALAQGQLLSAVAQVGSHRVEGRRAIEAIVSSRAAGRFVFERLSLPGDTRWLYEVVDEACDALRTDAARRLEAAATQPGRLVLDDDLAQLFARVATLTELRVLDAVKSAPESVASLAESLGLPEREVRPVLAELLRRGVLSTGP